MTIWPASLPRSLDYPALPATAFLRGAASAFPDRVALCDGDESLTYGELLRTAAKAAHGLRANGIREGDVVALHGPNGLWHPVGYYAILLAGGTVALLNPLQPAPALAAQLRETGAVAAITHPSCAESLPDLDLVVTLPATAVAPGLTAIGVGLPELARGRPSDPPEIRTGPDDTALLAYTGGTTGASKPVQVLHRNLVANVLHMSCWRAGVLPEVDGSGIRFRELPDTADFPVDLGRSVSVVTSPLYHQHALVTLNFLVACGVTAVIAGRFDPAGLLDLVERHGATYTATAPTAYQAVLAVPDLAERDLSSVRAITSGAGPMDAATHAGLAAAFPNATVLEGYGLTEATCTVTFPPTTPDGLRKIGTVGVPGFDTEIEIRDLEDLSRCVPQGADGEVWVRGPQVTAGYLGRPDATAEQFPDGWLRTGDIGRLDEDGYLAITGRAKDMLIYKGYNVYPRELEELLTGVAGVRQASVVGRPDPVAGELPVAFVVADPGAGLTAEALMAHVGERVLPYKRIREVVFTDRLPTSPAGKVLKTELRSRLVRA
ncbi:class I adenylate-forming enzyme family protein [Pseudonocardia halophobica]|uniref:class I adenylate-forming enzyme family protein n=1 Tax=Pseudonocardia halophobica TaxID=29401 RepID=UPI003D8DFA13